LLGVSVLGNYALGRHFATGTFSERGLASRKAFIVYGLVFNISLLAYFKYVDFLLGTVGAITGWAAPVLRIGLPLGISFFTIQQIRYIVDAYEGLAVSSDPLEYALFVSFFPCVISGPITEHTPVVRQLRTKLAEGLRAANVAPAVYLFTLGLAKKALIADALAPVAAQAYANPAGLTMVEGWITSLAFTFQMYFDFSGYSDMAIACALLFNIEIPANFESPYRSRGVIEFWKRWHITLSVFITNYIYNPILRSYKTVTLTRAMFATVLAMTIAGIWHGAGWPFVVWGVLHGSALVVNHVWRRKVRRKLPSVLAWAITFAFVNVSLVFFRAPTVRAAFQVLRAIVDVRHLVLPASLQGRLAPLRHVGAEFGVWVLATDTAYKAGLLVALGLTMALFARNTQQLLKTFRPTWGRAIAVAVLFVLSVMSLTKVQGFLYFNF
jgi:alginate O-acetyltransferase complex protein AlgI